MFYPIMLIIFLIQFLVVLGAFMFVIFFARPIVPLSGYGPQESSRGGCPSLTAPAIGPGPHFGEKCVELISPSSLSAQVFVALQVGCRSADCHDI